MVQVRDGDQTRMEVKEEGVGEAYCGGHHWASCVSLVATSGSTLISAMSRVCVTSWLHCWSFWMTVSVSSLPQTWGCSFLPTTQKRG